MYISKENHSVCVQIIHPIIFHIHHPSELPSPIPSNAKINTIIYSTVFSVYVGGGSKKTLVSSSPSAIISTWSTLTYLVD